MTFTTAERTAARLGHEPALEGHQARLSRPADVVRLRGSMPIEHSLAALGAEKLWHLCTTSRS